MKQENELMPDEKKHLDCLRRRLKLLDLLEPENGLFIALTGAYICHLGNRTSEILKKMEKGEPDSMPKGLIPGLVTTCENFHRILLMLDGILQGAEMEQAAIEAIKEKLPEGHKLEDPTLVAFFKERRADLNREINATLMTDEEKTKEKASAVLSEAFPEEKLNPNSIN
jgi:hypothetical protein